MKAAVLKKLGQPFQIESVPEPAIGPDEVLVQTRTCGICRTDLHIQDGLAYVPALPGCISEGEDVKEALANICEAIGLYLEPTEDDLVSSEHALVEEIELGAGFPACLTTGLCEPYNETAGPSCANGEAICGCKKEWAMNC